MDKREDNYCPIKVDLTCNKAEDTKSLECVHLISIVIVSRIEMQAAQLIVNHRDIRSRQFQFRFVFRKEVLLIMEGNVALLFSFLGLLPKQNSTVLFNFYLTSVRGFLALLSPVISSFHRSVLFGDT